MARHLSLLDATQRRVFDQPPTFNRPQQQLFFALPDWATQFLATLLAPQSQGGFVLQVGTLLNKNPYQAQADHAVGRQPSQVPLDRRWVAVLEQTG